MEWYWIVLISLGGVLLLYIVFCMIITKFVVKAAVTPVAHTLDEAFDYQQQHENIDFTDYKEVWKKEDFEVDGKQGKIRGEIIYNPQNSPRTKVAVICHGHTWNRVNSVKYAKIFYDLGYNIVLFDHAYFGLSDGKYTTLGCFERYDLSAVLDFVREKFGKDAILGLHGESLGAATVLLELGLRQDIDFVVADCPFSDTMKYYRELCLHLTHLPGFPIVDMSNVVCTHKYNYNFKKVVPLEAVRSSDTPICFIHGKDDDFILPKHSQRMYEVCKNPLSELHLVEGAGHARSHVVNNANYRTIVTNFVQKVEALMQ